MTDNFNQKDLIRLKRQIEALLTNMLQTRDREVVLFGNAQPKTIAEIARLEAELEELSQMIETEPFGKG